MKKLIAFTFITSFLLSASAFALPIQTLVLNYNHAHFTSNGKLKLKQKIQQQYPGYNLAGVKLIKAKLVAKSRFGNGKARLRVGSSQSFNRTIPGSVFNFGGTGGYTMKTFLNPNASYASAGAWQFRLQGNFKVKKVVLKLKFPAPAASFYTIAEIRTERWVETEVISVGRAHVKKILLKGTRKDTKIKEVLVTWGNGNTTRLYALEGKLKEGQMKGFNIGAPGGRYVIEVAVTARSKKLFGKRSKYELKVAQ